MEQSGHQSIIQGDELYIGEAHLLLANVCLRYNRIDFHARSALGLWRAETKVAIKRQADTHKKGEVVADSVPHATCPAI